MPIPSTYAPLTVWFSPFTSYFVACVGYAHNNNRNVTIEELILLAAKRGGMNG